MSDVGIFTSGVGLVLIVMASEHQRGTSLFPAMLWMFAAWVVWLFCLEAKVLASWGLPVNLIHTAPVLATGCAGIAVLGARRPYHVAWSWVCVGLFAVMLLPYLEQWLIGVRSMDWLRLTFLVAVLFVGLLNYLPTRFCLPALLVAIACGGELAAQRLAGYEEGDVILFGTRTCLAAAPLLGWYLAKRPSAGNATDDLWLSFRDQWGSFWALRVREQFNHAANNAGWSVTLTWQGLAYREPPDEKLSGDVDELMKALLKRFVRNEAVDSKKTA